MMSRMLIVALAVGLLQVPTAGQRAPFATPPPGSGPTPMRPFGMVGGCPEQPAQFHTCAMAKAKTFNPPRTKDGLPDLQGYWSRVGIRNMENIEEHPETMDGSGGTSSIVDPPDGRIPYLPWAAAKREGHFSTYRSPVRYCVPHGSPAQSYLAGGFQVVQTPGNVLILNEYSHTYRIIPTDGRPHPDDHEPSYLGDSVARWEGDTLVVDVVGFNTDTWLAGVGTIHSEKLRVTERYTRDTFDTIVYDVTMEDPEVFTKPWRQQETFRLRPNERIREYECIENNEDLLRIEKLLQNESVFRK